MVPTLTDIKNNLFKYTNPNYIRTHLPEFYKEVSKINGQSWSEKLYIYYYGEPGGCPECGARPKYVNFTIGFREFCSQKCARASKLVKERRKKTNLDRYGVSAPAKLESVREKMKETNLVRYGVEHALQNDDIKRRSRESCMKKYGVEYTGQTESRIRKTKETNRLRYGVDWYLSTKECREKIRETCLERYGRPYGADINKARQVLLDRTKDKYNALAYDGRQLTMPCPHPECNKCTEHTYHTTLSLYIDRVKHGCETCTKLFQPHSKDYGVSNASQMFFAEIDNLFEGYTTYYHLKNKEYCMGPYYMDYYIKELNVCIEFYGDDWHANPAKYQPTDIPIPQTNKTAQEIWEHDKTRKEYLEQQGIAVIEVWASEWSAGTAIKKIKTYLTSLGI